MVVRILSMWMHAFFNFQTLPTYLWVLSFQIDTVGGCSVLLGLIAMAQDVECLYAGVKALVCVVRSNKAAQAEMDRRKGYQTLSMLLKRKKQLLNSHILHLIFGLVGTVDSQKETSSIPNLTAFQVSWKLQCFEVCISVYLSILSLLFNRNFA